MRATENFRDITLPLISERLVVRLLEVTDLATRFDLLESDPDVAAYSQGPIDRALRSSWIESKKAQIESEVNKPSLSRQLAVVLRSTNQIIGRAGLPQCEIHKPVVELSIFLGKEWWKNGYGTELGRLLLSEAFARMGVSEVRAVVSQSNKYSEMLVRKLGFEKSGEVLSPGHWQHGHLQYVLPREPSPLAAKSHGTDQGNRQS